MGFMNLITVAVDNNMISLIKLREKEAITIWPTMFSPRKSFRWHELNALGLRDISKSQ